MNSVRVVLLLRKIPGVGCRAQAVEEVTACRCVSGRVFKVGEEVSLYVQVSGQCSVPDR